VLSEAKNQALIAYQTLHKRHRLDGDATKRKQRLISSSEWKVLSKLALIESLGGSKIDSIIGRLQRLIAYKGVSDDQLLKSPTSMHPTDPYNPRDWDPNISASDILLECESETEATLADWQTRLLFDLTGDPSTQSSISALRTEERKGIDSFVLERKLPESIDDAFISAINQVLKGLKKKSVNKESFAKAIFSTSSSLRPDELRQRVDEWIKVETQNEEASQVRFVLED
jgi:hypothetical protein